MEKKELSVLIPAYNTVCVPIVERVLAMCQDIICREPAFKYEVVVADDASPLRDTIEQNRRIGTMPNCRFIEKDTNTGSAATRNFLTKESRYQWLLFLDCDMQIATDDFILRYLNDGHEGVVNGGIAIGEGDTRNLRRRYEMKCAPNHTAMQRQKHPYHCFRSTNFLVARDVMLRCPFDERFKKSGYEDVLLGKLFESNGVEVFHFDNPTVMTDFETNPDFVAKTERSLHTLYEFRTDLQGYSRLLSKANGIWGSEVVSWLVRLWHRLFGHMERRNLCGHHPRLKVFDLYRLGYYFTLTKK